MEHLINIQWDDEARVWYASCESIPLVLESGSFDALIERIKIAAPEMIAENGGSTGPVHLCFRSERHYVAN